MRSLGIIVALIASLLVSCDTDSHDGNDTIGIYPAEAITGDSVNITLSSGKAKNLKLCGINAISPQAKNYLQKLINNSENNIIDVFWNQDNHVEIIVNKTQYLNAEMLMSGMAKLSDDHNKCPNTVAFEVAENEAKEKKLGIWANN